MVNACVGVCACEHRCSQRLEVSGTAVPGGVSCPTWVLGTELSLPLLEVFDQKASSLKHLVICFLFCLIKIMLLHAGFRSVWVKSSVYKV